MLDLNAVTLAYGPVVAVQEASLRVAEGEIVTLIGANGAGKTTILRAVSRLLKPRTGTISFQGRNLGALAPDKVVRLGLAHCPEGRQVLARQSVLGNLELGAYIRSDKSGIRQDLDMVFGLFPRLRERSAQLAGTLSGGEQQMLAIGRALMAKPKLLLLDEPSMGLAPIVVQEIFRILVEINRRGLTILLVEQNVRQALKIAKHGYVIETGKIVLADSGANLLANPKVEEAYLGG